MDESNIRASAPEREMAESLARAMLDALPMPVSWAEANGNIAFWNRRAEQLFGYSSEQVANVEAWYALAYPDASYRAQVVERWNRAVQEAINGGGELHFEAVRIRTRMGTDLDVEISATVVHGRLLVVFNDLTERQHAERSVRESEARLSAAFAAIPDACAISKVDTGQYLLVNAGFTQITGFQPEEALGKSSADLNLWVDYAQRNEVVKQLVEKGAVNDYEASFRRQNGAIINGVISGRVVRAGETPIIVTITRDVTAQRILERKLQEAERLDSIGRLAGGVAHDFNNLLTVIQGNLELALLDLPQGHRLQKDLQETMAASRRAAKLTSQLLAFGRKQVLSARSVDLNVVLVAIEDLLRRVVGEGIELELELAPELSPVLVDQSQLEQVVLNLVFNARDAMPGGGLLHLKTEQRRPEPGTSASESGQVRLLVTDTGAGMSPEVRARLFEPFFTTKELGKGSGLGLASVYGIVKQSGGHIEVQSAPGRGTTFMLEFAPVERAAEASRVSTPAVPRPTGPRSA